MMYIEGLADAVVRHGGRIYENTKYWTTGGSQVIVLQNGTSSMSSKALNMNFTYLPCQWVGASAIIGVTVLLMRAFPLRGCIYMHRAT